MNNKKLKLILIILLIFIIFILSILLYMNYRNKLKNKDKIILNGNIEIRTVDLAFKVAGRIEKMLYEEGDVVKKGDLLAILDNRDYEASYNKSKALILQSKALMTKANNDYKRHIELCEENITSKQQCDTFLERKNETYAQYMQVLAQNNIDKINLDDTKLYSPSDGIITTRIEEEGAIVNPNQSIYTLTKNYPIWVRAYVNEKDLGNIQYGTNAIVKTDSINPNTGKPREYKGTIGFISPVAEFTPKTVETTNLRTDLVYQIRVYINDDDGFLRQGMPLTIIIDTKH